MNWLDSPIMVFDAETTGLKSEEDRIWEFSILKFEAKKRWSELQGWTIRCNPVVEFSDGALSLYSEEFITGEINALYDGLPFERYLDGALDILEEGDIYLAYNADFDLGFLQAALRRSGLERELPIHGDNLIDPLVFARALYPRVRGRKLSQMAARLNVPMDTFHTATADCIAAAEIMVKMAVRENLPVDLEPLCTLQEKYRLNGSGRSPGKVPEPPRASDPLV